MKNKIIEFLNTESEDYLDLIKQIAGNKSDPFLNSELKKGYVEEWYPRKYISKVTGRNCNILFNVKEVDFTKFSWTFLRLFTRDQNLIDIMNIIDEINEENKDPHVQFRIKRMRINIFIYMNYVSSPFFNSDVYKKCCEEMYIAMKKLNDYLDKKVRIISTTYDSVMFIGQPDYQELKELVKPAQFKIREYDQIIHFRNLLASKIKNGDWLIKKTTATSYDEIKIKIIDLLKESNFTEAIMLLNKSDMGINIKPKYIKDIIAVRELHSK